MFESEPISAVLTAVALILTALGGFAFRRGSEKGKKDDPLEMVVVALENNSRIMQASNDQFVANNGMFERMGHQLVIVNDHLKEIERDGTERLQVLRAMRDEDLRKGTRR